MKRMRLFPRFVLLLGVLLILQQPAAANGLNLSGMGSRALGMGGAYIALAGDISTFFFNPAGATRIDNTQLSLFETNLLPTGTYALATPYFTIDTQTTKKWYPAGALAFVKPLSKKLVVGIGAFTPSGTGAVWDGQALSAMTSKTAFEWNSFLGMLTIAPLVAYKIDDIFSVGATLNLDYGWMDIKRPALGQYQESSSGFAVGGTFGLQIRPSEDISFGITYRTPVKVTLSGDAKMSMATAYHLNETTEFERQTTLPGWFGIGVAIRPVKNLTVTFDIQVTNWEKLQQIPIEYTDATWNAALADSRLKSYFDQTLDLKWQDTAQVRLGAEYQLNKFAIRAGYYSDPSPSPLGTMTILLPQVPYDAYCAGLGYSCGKLSINAAVEVLKGKDQTVTSGKMPGVHGMSLVVPSIQIAYSL